MTVTKPLPGEGEYPEIVGTVNGKLPLGSWKVIVLEEEVWVTLFRTTDQVVPDGSPDSGKETVYVTWVQVMVCSKLFPEIEIVPLEGLAT